MGYAVSTYGSGELRNPTSTKPNQPVRDRKTIRQHLADVATKAGESRISAALNRQRVCMSPGATKNYMVLPMSFRNRTPEIKLSGKSQLELTFDGTKSVKSWNPAVVDSLSGTLTPGIITGRPLRTPRTASDPFPSRFKAQGGSEVANGNGKVASGGQYEVRAEMKLEYHELLGNPFG
ncbi:hypothetical protein OBBRIDRAFT_871619 [Obba rivulosa]|uniref:Uncharacterized protein n=1 Tax=Obba rivulosa TaxID=1052685 RepID=A0A8E2DUD3_9APHY|nr:hypothetical protein OBBRIDRAFT_871619 [Obba rivulosa]